MDVLIVIPAFDEEKSLADNIAKLHGFLSDHCRWKYQILIAENGSTDRTLEVARSLSLRFPQVDVSHTGSRGRGLALKKAWSESAAEVVSYMDADLSSDLRAFPVMIEALVSGGFDVATGSRLLDPSLTTRGFKREVASRCYNRLAKVLLKTHFSDAQCGFKAMTRKAAQRLLPLVQDEGWFFDTELLALAEKLGYRIFDLPIRWIENRESHVKMIQTAVDDIRGLLRLRKKLAKTASPGSKADRETARAAPS